MAKKAVSALGSHKPCRGIILAVNLSPAQAPGTSSLSEEGGHVHKGLDEHSAGEELKGMGHKFCWSRDC